MVGKKEKDEERKVLTALALMGDLILGQRQLKFKANQGVGSITEVAVLKVNETNKFRELCRCVFGIPGNRSK